MKEICMWQEMGKNESSSNLVLRMAAYIGRVGEFHEGKEEWSQYAEYLNHFLLANGIKDE